MQMYISNKINSLQVLFLHAHPNDQHVAQIIYALVCV
jgi:hypothetical protein